MKICGGFFIVTFYFYYHYIYYNELFYPYRIFFPIVFFISPHISEYFFNSFSFSTKKDIA